MEPVPSDRVAAVLWTGGKDCALALHEAVASGYDVRALVTFGPPRGESLAHPYSIAQLQARALGLERRVVPISPPYDKGYEEALRALGADGIGTLVTGDIARVDGRPNWIRERAGPSGIRVLTPLWERRRERLLQAIQEWRICAVVSFARRPPLSKDWVGRELDPPTCAELIRRGRTNGFDPCGEQGEYHSMVLDAPLFSQRIDLQTARAVHHGDGWHLAVAAPRLRAKDVSAHPGGSDAAISTDPAG